MNLDEKISRRKFLKSSLIMPFLFSQYLNQTKQSQGPLKELEENMYYNFSQRKRIEERMNDALKYEGGRVIWNQEIPLEPEDFLDLIPIGGVKKYIQLRVEQMPEYVRVLFSVPKNRLFTPDKIGDCEIYVISYKKSRFEREQFLVIIDKVGNKVIRHVSGKKECVGDACEIITDEGTNILYDLAKKIGLNKTTVNKILKLLNRRKALQEFEQDLITEMVNERFPGRNYIMALGVKKPDFHIFKNPEEKLREVLITEGEKSLVALVLAGSLVGYKMGYEVVPVNY